MFNELLSKLGRERDLPFSEPESQTKGLQSVLASLGNNQPSEPATERGLGGWLRQAQQQGGFFERLGTFGAELQDTADGGNRAQSRTENAAKLAAADLARKTAEGRIAAQQALMSRLRGGGTTAPGVGPTTTPNGGGSSLPSLRSAGPDLLAAQAAGVDIGDYIALLDKASPSVQVANGVAYDPQATAPGSRVGVSLQNINGFLTDTQDPENANLYRPDLEAGQEPVYDRNGRVTGVRNIDGAVQSVAQREGAITTARQGAEAPYRFLTTTDSSGRPVQTAISNVAGGSVVGADPVAIDSRARNATDLDSRLTGLRTAVSAGRGQLATINQLRPILPDVITGPGADLRLSSARFLAAAGNEEARRRVAATETYQNQSRYIVADLVKQFGSNPTEGERKYAAEMAGGDINITPEAIEAGFKLFEQRLARQEGQLTEAEQQAQARTSGGNARPSSGAISREAAMAEARRRGLIP